MTSKPHFYYMQKLECRRVAEQLVNRRDAPVPKLFAMNNTSAKWQIEMSDGKTCFMNNIFTDLDDEFYLVHVDALRFYQYWLSSSIAQVDKHRSVNCQLKKLMHMDYKYHRAVIGFSNGSSNPVPVAQIFAENKNETPYLGFVNGVTRSLWLLANEAKSFPVEVHYERSAIELFNAVGVGESYIRYDELKALRYTL